MYFIKHIDILKIAYAKILDNTGVSFGKSKEVNEEYFIQLNKELGIGSYQCQPSKRIYIKKKDGKDRPISIPSFKDKIVQESIRMILEAIYEPIFVDNSHGFRPNRSTHTALKEIRNKYTAVN